MQWLPKALLLTLFVAACSPGDNPAGPSATLDERPADAETALEQEVEAAYLRSWEVYAAALRSLSTAGLEESFAGPALDSTIAEVNRFAQAGTPVMVKMDHAITLRNGPGDLVTITDRQVNRSVYIDRATGRPTESAPAEVRLFTYSFKRVEDAWRVVAVERLS